MDLTVSLTLNGTQAQVAAVEGAASVSVRKAQRIENFNILEGAGDSTAEAAAKTGTGATVSDNRSVPLSDPGDPCQRRGREHPCAADCGR